jgi:hypothetical protein
LIETLTEMERARWEIVDVEGLRLHYARTCRQWAARLDAGAETARAIVGERIYRTWRLYLMCSAVAFESGSVGLYQVLLRKQRDRTVKRDVHSVHGPATRNAVRKHQRRASATTLRSQRLVFMRPRRLASEVRCSARRDDLAVHVRTKRESDECERTGFSARPFWQ